MLFWMNLGGKSLRQVEVNPETHASNGEFRKLLSETFNLAPDAMLRLRSPEGALVVCNARALRVNTRQKPYRLEVVTAVSHLQPIHSPNTDGDKTVVDLKLDGLNKRIDKLESLFEGSGQIFPSHEKLLALQTRIAFAKRLIEALPEPSVGVTDDIPENWQSPFW